jgi:hypothetical protein
MAVVVVVVHAAVVGGGVVLVLLIIVILVMLLLLPTACSVVTKGTKMLLMVNLLFSCGRFVLLCFCVLFLGSIKFDFQILDLKLRHRSFVKANMKT